MLSMSYSLYLRKSGPVDNGPRTGQSVIIYSLSVKRQNATLSEQQNGQPDKSTKQCHVTSYSQQASKPGRTGVGRGACRFHITEEEYY